MSNDSHVCIQDVLALQGDWTVATEVHVLFAVLYAATVIASVIGNSCVVICVLSHQDLRTTRNLFIVALACTDATVATVSGTVTPTFLFMTRWIWSFSMCYIVLTIQAMSTTLSTYTLTMIAIDRYFLIVHPTSRWRFTPSQASIAIFGVFVTAAAIAAPYVAHIDMQTFADFCNEQICTDYWENESHRKIYGVTVLVVGFAMPMLIITFAYTLIVNKLKKGVLVRQAKQTHSIRSITDGEMMTNNSFLTPGQRNALRRTQRINRMLIAMVVAFTCSWLPQSIFNILNDIGVINQETPQKRFMGACAHCISMTSTIWNPLLYAWLNPQMQVSESQQLTSRTFSSRAFRRLLPRFFVEAYFKRKEHHSTQKKPTTASHKDLIKAEQCNRLLTLRPPNSEPSRIAIEQNTAVLRYAVDTKEPDTIML